MFDKEIATLLQKSLPTPPLMVCQRTLRHDIDDLVAMVFHGIKLAVVADCNTEKVLGNDVFRALKARFPTTLVFLPEPVIADDITAKWLHGQTQKCDALVAVGSGTINDLCKYVAFTDGKPYIVFPTAASMNGYFSANASTTIDGYKKTVKAQMPQAVFCDLEVITGAPMRLSKSGLGDSLARPTAQADWLMSHLLLGTPYNEIPFQLLQPVEADLFDNARGIAKRDPKTIESLVHTLVLSGLGMTIAGGSYPASQGEHMIAHAMEMLPHKGNNPHSFHGEQIGVTTITMARLQEKCLRSSPSLQIKPFPSGQITALFGETVADEAAKSYRIKTEMIQAASHQYSWDGISEQLEPIMMPPQTILSILQSAEAPHTPETLGWADADYHHAVTYSPFLRERVTFLDL